MLLVGKQRVNWYGILGEGIANMGGIIHRNALVIKDFIGDCFQHMLRSVPPQLMHCISPTNGGTERILWRLDSVTSVNKPQYIVCKWGLRVFGTLLSWEMGFLHPTAFFNPTNAPLPEHWPHNGIQRNFDVKFISAREFNIDGSVPGDYVPCVVCTFNPDGVFVHNMCAVGLYRRKKEAGGEWEGCHTKRNATMSLACRSPVQFLT